MFSLFCSPVFAAEGEQWELSGGTQAPLNFLFSGSTATSFNFTAEAGYFITPMFQISLEPSVVIFSSGSTFTTIQLGVGPTINFGGESPRDAFALGARAGFASSSGGGVSATNFSYAFSLHKRFPISSSVSYKPGVGFSGVTSSPSAESLVISPLEFSFFF